MKQQMCDGSKKKPGKRRKKELEPQPKQKISLKIFLRKVKVKTSQESNQGNKIYRGP